MAAELRRVLDAARAGQLVTDETVGLIMLAYRAHGPVTPEPKSMARALALLTAEDEGRCPECGGRLGLVTAKIGGRVICVDCFAGG